ncbi:MAG TPA: tetraacyldisaccharide 4'-kinase [Dissulfurispiraceae bacterium]|nr:tetraacyldisaccharide 4'-kinase [Dissulfurispiraceae bacterium]
MSRKTWPEQADARSPVRLQPKEPTGYTEGAYPMNLMEHIYLQGMLAKRKRMLAAQKRLPYPVVSIGNLTVGGTGKTPAAIAVAEEAIRRGYAPVILTRGYRGKAKGPCFVSAGKGALLGVRDAGDEPVLIAERLPGVPVVKSQDRHAGGQFALEHLTDTPYAAQEQPRILFILDDGFQHWKLARTIDIVLVDGTSPFGNRRLLPLGPLREPLSALRRSHLLAITKAPNEPLERELRQLHPQAGLCRAEYSVHELRASDGNLLPAKALRGQRVLGFCGIANPKAFQMTLESLGAETAYFRSYPDHYVYNLRDVEQLSAAAGRHGCTFLITTEKDLVKLKSLNLPVCVHAVAIGLSFSPGFFDDLFGRIEKTAG